MKINELILVLFSRLSNGNFFKSIKQIQDQDFNWHLLKKHCFVITAVLSHYYSFLCISRYAENQTKIGMT